MSAPPRCRWFQLSLRSLFLLTLVVAVFFAGYSLAERKAQHEAQRAEEARKHDEGKQLGLGIHLYHGDVNVTLPSAGSNVADESSIDSGGTERTFSFYIGTMR
jgi:hypothetical protein